MSEQNGFGWKKRTTTRLECPSGASCLVRRPGPEMSLKASRIARPLQKLQSENGEPQTLSDFLEKMASLNDDELAKVVTYAREMVLACVVNPRIVARPSPGIEDEIGPEDIPEVDFWFIFNWGANGGRDLPVKVAGEEATVDQVVNFPDGEGSSLAVIDVSGTVLPEAVESDVN